MIFPKDFIDDLKSKVNLIDIADPNRTYKGNGQHIIMPCPFHDDSHPSLAVHADHFHCFTAGCNESGDAIKWIRSIYNLSFSDAIEYLAKQYSIELPASEHNYTKLSESSEQAALNDAHLLFQSNFQKIIPYLEERKISEDTALTFGTGYVSDEGCYPLTKKYDAQTLINAGLMRRSQSDSAKLINIFRNRIIFPVYKSSSSKKIAGFCGRSLNNATTAKYINSPENNEFKKSNLLFGLNIALPEIKKTGIVIVVEGFFDVLSLHEHGIKNVVSSMGTALTEQHFKQLVSLSNEIILCFDGDIAGKKASRMSAAKIISWMKDGDQVSFLDLPYGYDPDDCLKNYGHVAWQFMLERRSALSAYIMKSFEGFCDTPEEMSLKYNRALKTLEMIPKAPVFKKALARHLSYIIGTDIKA